MARPAGGCQPPAAGCARALASTSPFPLPPACLLHASAPAATHPGCSSCPPVPLPAGTPRHPRKGGKIGVLEGSGGAGWTLRAPTPRRFPRTRLQGGTRTHTRPDTTVMATPGLSPNAARPGLNSGGATPAAGEGGRAPTGARVGGSVLPHSDPPACTGTPPPPPSPQPSPPLPQALTHRPPRGRTAPLRTAPHRSEPSRAGRRRCRRRAAPGAPAPLLRAARSAVPGLGGVGGGRDTTTRGTVEPRPPHSSPPPKKGLFPLAPQGEEERGF